MPKNHGGMGIRDQGRMKKAYVAKLGWKMSQDATNLAQECIRFKYFNFTKIMSQGLTMALSHGKTLAKDGSFSRGIVTGIWEMVKQ